MYRTNNTRSMYDFTDPTKIGPGAWFYMHLMAAHCTNKQEELACVRNIELLCHNFKCHDCQRHAEEYIVKHPPANSLDHPYGLFYWTVEFRNNVNRRLGKPLYDPYTMLGIFKNNDSTVCSANCGAQSNHAEPNYVDITASNDRITLLANKMPSIIVPNKPKPRAGKR